MHDVGAINAHVTRRLEADLKQDRIFVYRAGPWHKWHSPASKSSSDAPGRGISGKARRDFV